MACTGVSGPQFSNSSWPNFEYNLCLNNCLSKSVRIGTGQFIKNSMKNINLMQILEPYFIK